MNEPLLPLVLVHGGSCGAWCWEPLLPHVGGEVLAVDLPPAEVRRAETRFTSPEALFDLTVADFADAVLAAVDERGLERFVLAGHSLGGLTIAEVARRAPERVAHLVFVSAAVPPEGGAVVDTLPPEIADMARDAIAHAMEERVLGGAVGLPEEMQRTMFCNDLDESQARFVLDHCGTEVLGVVGENVTRAGIPPELPKTFVKLWRDQSLPPDNQDQLIANLRASPGGAVDVVEIDAGHMVMISRPDALAAMLEPLRSATT
jgi:pimeloyl-ACP methyl ester carboxylesterase